MKYERIREMRDARGAKQEEIARLLNIKQTTYSKYELGKMSIPIESWAVLADYFDTSIDYLVGRTDEDKPYLKSEK